MSYFKLVQNSWELVSSPHRTLNYVYVYVYNIYIWWFITKYNQSGYEPLNLENGSTVNSGNFDATDLRS